jgi:hypothetical protein
MAPIDLPDFTGMARTADQYADRVLSRYVGEALEELTPVLRLLSNNLKRCEVFTRRAPSAGLDYVDTTLRNYEELIPYLNDYGVEDTAPLEDIRDKLAAWLRQQGRGKGPQPAPM